MCFKSASALFVWANLLPTLVSAWYHPSRYAQVRRNNTLPSAEEYDYVILGGGTSGLTVGNRLSEDGKYTVLVLEYGYFDPDVDMNPRRMFNITSEAQPNLLDRSFYVGLGCAVGGSSIVNGKRFLRGTKVEYNAWKELGGPNSTWDWDGLLPYFKKAVTLNPPNEAIAKEFNITYDPELWGTGAPIHATYGPATPRPLHKNLYEAMAGMPGMTLPADSGAGEAGLYWYPFSMNNVDFKRSSARTGHWDNINRANYEILVGAKANKINFDGTRAVSVAYVSRNDSSVPPVTIKARKQVILAAGSVHTPQILLQSGIGPRSLLKSYDIPIVQDLPGVGSNFQDHQYIPSISYVWGITPNGTWPNTTSHLTRRQGPIAEPWLAALPGLKVMTPDRYENLSQTYESQDPLSHLPPSYTTEQIEGYKQQQKVMANFIREQNVQWNDQLMFGPGGSIQNLHPLSRGTVHPPVNNVDADMRVDYRAMTNSIDLDVMVEIIKFMRRYMTESSLKVFKPKEILPGPNIKTDDQLREWARTVIIPSVYHPVGTAAKMPREWGGVVDEDLGVHGLEGLSIVDGSIMPVIFGAPTQMTVYAVAEKAVDLIKAKTQ